MGFFDEAERGESALNALPSLMSPGLELQHEVWEMLPSPAGPLRPSNSTAYGGFCGFGNGNGNHTFNLAINSPAAPAPTEAPSDLRENSDRLRSNTKAVRSLTATMDDFAATAEDPEDYWSFE